MKNNGLTKRFRYPFVAILFTFLAFLSFAITPQNIVSGLAFSFFTGAGVFFAYKSVRHNKLSDRLIGIICILIISMLVIITIFDCVKETKRPPISFPETITQKEVPTDKTTNWQTYRNEKFGYEIKYPADWISTEEGHPTAYLSRKDFSKTDKSIGKIAGQYGGEKWPDYLFSIIVQDESGKEYWGITGIEADDEVIIDSSGPEIKGLVYKTLLGIPSTIGEIVKIVKGEYVYYITFGGSGISETDQKNLDIFHEILATFKFLY